MTPRGVEIGSRGPLRRVGVAHFLPRNALRSSRWPDRRSFSVAQLETSRRRQQEATANKRTDTRINEPLEPSAVSKSSWKIRSEIKKKGAILSRTAITPTAGPSLLAMSSTINYPTHRCYCRLPAKLPAIERTSHGLTDRYFSTGRTC